MLEIKDCVEILQNERKAIMEKNKWKLIGINVTVYPLIFLIISLALFGVEIGAEYLPFSGLFILLAILLIIIVSIFLPAALFLRDTSEILIIDEFIDNILKGLISINNFYPQYQILVKKKSKFWRIGKINYR